jgi:hypothetical protein
MSHMAKYRDSLSIHEINKILRQTNQKLQHGYMSHKKNYLKNKLKKKEKRIVKKY